MKDFCPLTETFLIVGGKEAHFHPAFFMVICTGHSGPWVPGDHGPIVCAKRKTRRPLEGAPVASPDPAHGCGRLCRFAHVVF